MNFHNDDWIMDRVYEHLEEAKQYFREEQIVGIFLQGSQNYELDYINSDIDTKLIVLPSLEEIAFNKKPISTTHIRNNNEHIDFKDIRLYIQTFRKQNLNFLEILYTKYKWVNPMYEKWWNELIKNREAICHYNIPQALKTMQKIAKEKYFAMEHEYPSKIEIISKYGYDPKQVSHLIRVEEYISRYINGEKYQNCLIPNQSEYILDIKMGKYNLDEARDIAKKSINHIDLIVKQFLDSYKGTINLDIDNLLDNIQGEIIRESLKREINK